MTDAIIDELVKIYEQDKRILIPKAELMAILDKLKLIVNISSTLETFGFDVKALASMARGERPSIARLDTSGNKENAKK